MEIKDIRPVPKYMIERIRKLDQKLNERSAKVRFYTYYTKFKGELASVTVAVKNHYKKWYCKQVVIHGIHSENVYLQDIGMTMGFLQIGWYREGITKYRTWHDYDWGWNDDKYFQMQTATIVNEEYILSLPEFKYSAVDKYQYPSVMKYLRFYEQYPECEYLVKMGLSRYAVSKQFLKKCSKDKGFCKWVIRHKDELISHYCYVSAVIRAYNQKMSVQSIQAYDEARKKLKTYRHYALIKQLFNEDIERFLKYISCQETNLESYADYLDACIYLGLDLSLEKNYIPHDFKRWHDIRIDEYRMAKALKDEEERKNMIERFSLIADKYIALQHNKRSAFVCIIAKSPQDLINEGEILHHCVGRMNYDQRFIREESLIFFVRDKSSPDIPYVTLEYSLKNNKILQCYGEHDSKPNEKVMKYVNKVWLPYANKQIQQIAA